MTAIYFNTRFRLLLFFFLAICRKYFGEMSITLVLYVYAYNAFTLSRT